MGRVSLFVVALVSVALGASAPGAAAAEPAKTLRIGLPESLFSGLSPEIVKTAAKPLKAMFEKELGLDGEVVIAKDYVELTELLRTGKLDVAIFHGVEYGWVKHHPEIVPLLVTVPKGPLRGHIVVNTASKATGPQDLKGECLALPRGTKAYSALFLERLRPTLPDGCCCGDAKLDGKSAEEVLDAVADGSCAAALVDSYALAWYKDNKPGVGTKLKVLVESDPFPSAIVVYRKDAFDDDTARRTRDGLIKGLKSPQGQLITSAWKVKAFEELSPAYQGHLEKCLKAYPAPK